MGCLIRVSTYGEPMRQQLTVSLTESLKACKIKVTLRDHRRGISEKLVEKAIAECFQTNFIPDEDTNNEE
jgi:hypothetical protein